MAPAFGQVQRSIERPRIHFCADCWINDPCAPWYNPRTKTYHLFYQCNPASCEWGNMSWGHIISKDLVTWTATSVSPALVPDQPYDSQGVFTGCWIPPTDVYDKTVRICYSSVKYLPFHWSTPPYPRDAAGLAIATSSDGGETWEKSSRNPILTGEPADLQVTGFRDPYVTESPSIDEARGMSARMLYGLVSGGIEGAGPTTFLYQIQRDNVEKWRYLGPLVDVPARFQPSKNWSGNYGVNWECTNLVTLHAGSEFRHFLLIGAEGDVEKEHVERYKKRAGAPSRTVRAQLWMSGRLISTSTGIKFRYEHGGYLDHGTYYAANSFLEPNRDRRIVHGWIPEEDITLEAVKTKSWNGSLAVPREIFLLRIPKVQRALRSNLADIPLFESKVEPDGSTTIFTLGIKPVSELRQLRDTSFQALKLGDSMMLPESGNNTRRTLFQASSASWELEAIIAVHSGCETVGFHLRHNKDLSIRTTITFCTITETITVDREASTTDPSINKCPDSGPFTLVVVKSENGKNSGEGTLEKLQLRIFSDGDILEIFANDTFALATMVYSESYTKDTGGVTAFATGSMDSTVFENVTLWDGLSGNKSDAQVEVVSD